MQKCRQDRDDDHQKQEVGEEAEGTNQRPFQPRARLCCLCGVVRHEPHIHASNTTAIKTRIHPPARRSIRVLHSASRRATNRRCCSVSKLLGGHPAACPRRLRLGICGWPLSIARRRPLLVGHESPNARLARSLKGSSRERWALEEQKEQKEKKR